MINPIEIIKRKRDGFPLSADEIAYLIAEYAEDRLPEGFMLAFLMAACCHDLTTEETRALTQVLMYSGKVLDFSYTHSCCLGLYSTSGVGDKALLVLGPIVAGMGLAMPIVQERTIGGVGTLPDKMNSIPGISTTPDLDQFEHMVHQIGWAIATSTAEIAPAENKLFQNPEIAGVIESLPLKTARILSRAFAAGLTGLLIEITTGGRVGIRDDDEALALANHLVSTGSQLDKRVLALMTNRNQPLGSMMGTALEIREAQALLQGQVQENGFLETILDLGSYLIWLSDPTATLPLEEARGQVEAVLRSGAALQAWQAMIQAQGGDPRIVDDDTLLPRAAHQSMIRASESGIVSGINMETLGWAAMILGAGRATLEAEIDPGVGLELHVTIGSEVTPGEPLCTVHYNDPAKLEQLEPLLPNCFTLGEEPMDPPEFIRVVITDPSAWDLRG